MPLTTLIWKSAAFGAKLRENVRFFYSSPLAGLRLFCDHSLDFLGG